MNHMATLLKKQFTKPLPPDAKIVSRTVKDRSGKAECKQFAQWTDRNGKKRSAEVSTGKDGSQRIKVEAATWTAKFRDGEGTVCEVATGCRDKQAAQSVLDDLLRRSELVKAKVLSPAQDKIADHQRKSLSDHLLAYVEHLKSRGVRADRIKTTETRMKRTAEACGWRSLSDLNVDSLEHWLGTLTEESTNDESRIKPISAAVFNGFVESWVAFGFWCIGKRMAGKRWHLNGDKRLLTNPFEGMRRRDAKQDRRRVARAMTEVELTGLLDAARRRPLEDAMTIRTGPNKGELAARVSDERKAKLKRVGQERALIYKTLVLTGLRADELRTLSIADLSFGDVPFIRLRHSNEKNRQGSTLAIRSDLAAELREWIKGRERSEKVFNVSKGILRIMNLDLDAAGIPKVDADGCVVHIHALRHSFGTHLSLAGVAPRVAQAAMRHSDIALTMNTYTDARLLDTAEAVESLQIIRPKACTELEPLAPTLAPNRVQMGQTESFPDNRLEVKEDTENYENCEKTAGFAGFLEVGVTRFELATSTSRT
ncbi:MAG: site-specific integrase [Planctomycetaceae bacterium]|nr:site-specific integrase [Planctomycetaceae bacterium]